MASSHPPPSFPREGQSPGAPFRDAVSLQEIGDGLDALALLEPHAAQLATEPSVEIAQRILALGMAEVGHPTCREGVHLGGHALQADAPVRWVIRRRRSLARARLFGAMPSEPPLPRRW